MATFAALVLVLLHGVVTRGPTQPVCQVGKPCSAPASGVVLVFSRSGRDVGRVRTDSAGRYAIRLAPGYYAVRVAPKPAIGRGMRPQRIHFVRASRIDFEIDTGIR
jgi:hypothetical protein